MPRCLKRDLNGLGLYLPVMYGVPGRDQSWVRWLLGACGAAPSAGTAYLMFSAITR